MFRYFCKMDSGIKFYFCKRIGESVPEILSIGNQNSMKRKKWLCLMAWVCVVSASGQSGPSPDTAQSRKVSYVPTVDGAVKVKLEFDLNSGEYRFNVRNARFGVKGNVSRNMFYRIQVDFSNEGNISILDSYVGYRTGGFDVRFGQQQYHFSSDLDRGPTTNMFANRSFLSKYLTSYYGSELSGGEVVGYTRTLGSRDLGLMLSYGFRTGVPLKAYAGVFNGSGINNPEWGKKVNAIGRLEIGGSEGLRGSVAYYDGYTPLHLKVKEADGGRSTEQVQTRMQMAGLEMRYVKGPFFIEGEYARRYLDMGDAREVMTAALVHSYYEIRLPEKAFASYVAPIVRWDLGNNVDYLNTEVKQREAFDANRITLGVNVGFGEKLIRSEIRLNYEKYLFGKKPSDFSTNRSLHDKFTIEVVASF